ncbi:MAG TPA: sigma 54-interacting transcriptional regulator [Gemmataceae bacterium]|nr:sigma 54-interacting transcriptional regulator [Gemmataceae bacterium]
MALFKPHEWSFTEKAMGLVTTNPFHPSWREEEAEILALPLRDVPTGIAWRPGAQLWGPQSVYSEEFDRRISALVERLRRQLEGGASASDAEWDRYELLSVYRLYCENGRGMDRWIDAAVRADGKGSGVGCPPEEDERPPDVKTLWADFHREYENLFRFKNRDCAPKYKPEHLFACFFLFRRAFYHIFFNIIGTSKLIAELRSRVWESIVTHDLLGWMQGLHERMKDIPTLITGPSGTGKERAAEAIGRSLYIPFKNGAFATDFVKAFNPVNLSALPPLLIEAELFGYVKGAFAGAVSNRIGRLEECPDQGAVFLDEVGEVTADIQVKLLRVLQERCFQSVGENKNKKFRGKIVAATNRDLVAEMHARRFREDFYYRLCADTIVTPSLREQLDDRPEDLPLLVGHVCRRVVGREKAAALAGEAADWIRKHPRLGPGYAWPGNFRELEQCVRGYMIRKDYQPVQPVRPRADDGSPRPPCDPVTGACETLAQAVLKMKATCAEAELKHKKVFDQIKRRLFTLVRDGTRTKQEAAALLGIDVRTLAAGTKATDPRPVDG